MSRLDGGGNAARAVPAKDGDEELARLVLTSVLGSPVTVHDTRSGHSVCDLKILRPDGTFGAAEVVSTRTPKLAAQLSAVRRAGYTADGGLRHLWIVREPPGVVISRVRPPLPGFLAELEKAGITSLDLDDHDDGTPLREQLRSLHVTSCLAYPPGQDHSPGFYVYPEATGLWAGDGDDIRLFCERFLRDEAQADVIAKLTASGAAERHVVIIATEDQFGLHRAVDTGLKPGAAPDLDSCIDWLWVIARPGPPARTCYWSRQDGWATATFPG